MRELHLASDSKLLKRNEDLFLLEDKGIKKGATERQQGILEEKRGLGPNKNEI